MLDAEHLIFCRLIQETQEGLNLLGVFDMVIAQRFPARHEPFLAQAWFRAKKPIYGQDIKVKIEVDYEGTKIAEQDATLAKANALKDDSLRVNINFGALVFEQPGKYYFKVYVEDKLLLKRVLRVRSIEELAER